MLILLQTILWKGKGLKRTVKGNTNFIAECSWHGGSAQNVDVVEKG